MNTSTIKGLLIFVVFIHYVIGCGSAPETHFSYTTLDIAALQPDSLPNNTPLHIIGFSGGESKKDQKIYYYQFITVNEAADTIRVLAPAITVPGTGDSGVTHTSPLQFDPQKNISDVHFRSLDGSQLRMLQLFTLPEGQRLQTEKVGSLLEADLQEKILVTNQTLPSFNRPHYKTVVGVLHFDQIPW